MTQEQQALISIAMKAYGPDTIFPHHGDTLALFVEREISDANGDAQEAAKMMETAIADLQRVQLALEGTLS